MQLAGELILAAVHLHGSGTNCDIYCTATVDNGTTGAAYLVADAPTANNFGIMYFRKRISQNSFPNFTYIFPKSFMIFYQDMIPKGIMKTRFEPSFTRMSS